MATAAWYVQLVVDVAVGSVDPGIVVCIIGDGGELRGIGPTQCHIAYHCEQRALVRKSLGPFGRLRSDLPLLMRPWVRLNSFRDEHLVFVSWVIRLVKPLAVSAFGGIRIPCGRRVRGVLLVRGVYVG